MKLPLKIGSIENSHLNVKSRFSVDEFGYDRSIRQNIWRRHQSQQNSALSGWEENSVKKRRLVHFRDKFEIHNDSLFLTNPYLHINIQSTEKGVKSYFKEVYSRMNDWNKINSNFYQFNDLEFTIYYNPTNQEIDFTFNSKHQNVTNDIHSLAEEVFNQGIRSIVPKGNPTYIQPKDILPYLPAMIELGCGPSIESGIPPLNFMHSAYSIMKPGGRFILDVEDDNLLLSMLENPEEKYIHLSYIHLKSLNAKITPFYTIMKELFQSGDIVGPILTNNFDGIPISLGLSEFCLRQYDEKGIYPEPMFNSKAKSLIVVGSHADRRSCQNHARKKGLKIIFIDPEGYCDGNHFKSYPLESPQNDDLICRYGASEAFTLLNNWKNNVIQ